MVKFFTSLALLAFLFFQGKAVAADELEPAKAINSRVSDTEFRNWAINLVTLLGNHSPENALHRFKEARKFFIEPALSEFDQTMLKLELKTIIYTERKQTFVIDRNNIKLERFDDPDFVVAKIPGDRRRSIAGSQAATDDMIYYVKMVATSSNTENGYAIHSSDVRLRSADPSRKEVPGSAYEDIILKLMTEVERLGRRVKNLEDRKCPCSDS